MVMAMVYHFPELQSSESFKVTVSFSIGTDLKGLLKMQQQQTYPLKINGHWAELGAHLLWLN